ncbi:MAG: toprim domain-containing protein [Burkholderiales bacterium]|nr:MAG: toprim domain-containing protein [Burkholderiales bacterium]
MPRIPESEIERLKNEVSVERLVEGSGVVLKKSGKDRLGRCPFHEDGEPSLVVTPGKNLWHCFGCGIGGGPIDWVIKQRGVSFRHAVELLREGLPSLAAGQLEGGGVHVQAHAHATTTRTLAPPVTLDADEQQLLDDTVDYYHQRLKAEGADVHGGAGARAYLQSRGLEHPELIEHFKLGVADRTLGLRLPEKNRKAGGIIRARLQRIGLLRESGHEHFNGSLVIPVLDLDGHVREVYGRKLLDNLRTGTPKHLYLPGPHAGVFNEAGLMGGGHSGEAILCEALIDALTFWCAGYRHVTSSYGVEGFTDEIVAAFKRHGIKRVLIAYDRDEAGERGAAKVVQRLMAEGMACWRIEFPRGMDANSYALKVQPAGKSLGLLMRQALWLGQGQAPQREDVPVLPQPASLAAASSLPVASPLVLPVQSVPMVEADPGMDSQAPMAPVMPVIEPAVELDGDTLRLVCGELPVQYLWQVRGLPKAHPGASLKLNVRVQRQGGHELALHVDSVDLYSARSRAVFAAQAAAEIGGSCGQGGEAAQRELARELTRQLGRVLLAVEQTIEAREQEASKPKQPVAVQMSEAEHAAALAWLKAPDLLGRILADFDACGLVGEATNKLTAYLACVSRLLASPLAVVVQSSSAAGKTSLMDAVLGFMPSESRIRYSAMTGQSLYYMGQTDLKHRILALAEEEGASRASYALKLLQSDGELTMAATGKDPTTGNLVTQEYHVEGPVMLMLTTTAIDIDEELMNRCLVLTVDEGAAQTQAIHARQRQARTLAGLLHRQGKQATVALHQNAQRLLRPLAVVNPYAEQLSFAAEHTRARRDHQKYLALIDAIALLHQHQRPIKTIEVGSAQPGQQGQIVEYIEVTREDIEAAHGIAHEVLGRSTDELPPVTRKLLLALGRYVASRAASEGVARAEVRFTRRELREGLGGWGDTQLRLHLERLAALEYLVSERGGLGSPGGQVRYSLRWDGPQEDDQGGQDAQGHADGSAPRSHLRPHLCGLVDPASLHTPSGSRLDATTQEVAGLGAQVAGLNEELAGQIRPDSGPDSGGVRDAQMPVEPALTGLGSELPATNGKTHRWESGDRAGLVMSYPQGTAVGAASSLAAQA